MSLTVLGHQFPRCEGVVICQFKEASTFLLGLARFEFKFVRMVALSGFGLPHRDGLEGRQQTDGMRPRPPNPYSQTWAVRTLLFFLRLLSVELAFPEAGATQKQ